MTAAWWRISSALVAVGAGAAILCGPAGSVPESHVLSAHRAPPARLTAILKAGTGSPTCDLTASLRPTGPPVVTPGSFMATIKARGYLIAGVDQNTYHFGYLNPLNGQIQGFDIDMLHAISAAIFGDPNKIKYVAMSNGQRQGAVLSGEVDIVAHTMTITCKRLKYLDFSTVYFDAFQRLLVDRNSAVTSLAGLPKGSRVCTSTSSTAIGFLRHDSRVHVVPVTYSMDCLVLLQEGRVDAISTDDAILAGLQAQDPETKIVGPPLEPNPYGLAISPKHPDFVRFVNGVLAQMRADGQWTASYERWIGTPAPLPPPAQYRD